MQQSGSSSSGVYHGGTKEQQHVRRIKEGISNMRNYNLPSTDDTIRGLEHIKNSPTHQEIESAMSPTGKRLVKDVDGVITVAQKLLHEKNEGDHFQQMLLHAKRAADLTDRETMKTMKGQGGQLTSNLSFSYSSFIDIVKMLISSSEFRSIAKSIISALMDIFKYNMGDSSVNKNALKDARDNFSSVAKGEQSGRDAAHGIVDVVSDTVDAVVPDRVREEVGSSVQPHMSDAAAGDKRKREAMRDAARDSYQAMKNRAYQMEVPQEYKDMLITNLKDSLMAVQKRPDFQKALDNFFQGISNVFESSKDYSKNQLHKGKAVLRQSEAEQEWKTAFDHARILIENIFNSNSLWDVIKAIRVFVEDIQSDNHLLAWFQGWKNFIHAVLRNPEYIESDMFKTEARELADQTNKLVSDRYRGHANEVFDQIKTFMSGAAEDPTNREFIDALRKLWSDACLDDEGNLVLKRELIRDIPRVVSMLSQKMAYIPLPRVEYDTPDSYFLMDNVILNCSGLIPTHMEMDILVRTDLSIPELVSYLTMRVSQIQISAQNVDFSIRKKNGIIRFSETGHMDFSIYGNGLSAELTFVPYIENTDHGVDKGLDLERCNVSIDALDINIYDTERHRLRYKLFKKPIQKIAKKFISRMISENLTKLLDPQGRADTNQMKRTAKHAQAHTSMSMPSGSSPPPQSSSRFFNFSEGSNQWVGDNSTAPTSSSSDLSPVVQKWANNASVYNNGGTYNNGGSAHHNNGSGTHWGNHQQYQQQPTSQMNSENESQGATRGMASKLRDLKMFRHANDSSVVKG